jgi:hypothetical protein
MGWLVAFAMRFRSTHRHRRKKNSFAEHCPSASNSYGRCDRNGSGLKKLEELR